MWAVFAFLRDAVQVLHSSLGIWRALAGLAIGYGLFAFYEQARIYLATLDVRGLPDIPGAWVAAAFASVFLIWHLLRYAMALHRSIRPVLSLKILDPSERYETYVALGNRLLRLYHVELQNGSRSTSASKANISLQSFQLAGDARQVDICSRLKVANSDAEEIELKPRGRVVFELCGVEVDDAGAAARAEARDAQTFSIIPTGSGTISLMAEAANAPACAQRYMLYVDARGIMTIKPQLDA